MAMLASCDSRQDRALRVESSLLIVDIIFSIALNASNMLCALSMLSLAEESMSWLNYVYIRIFMLDICVLITRS